IQMFDDGAHNDGLAADGVYGADLPGFVTGTYVRFYVEAKAGNAAGTTTFAPVGAEHDVYYYRVSAAWAADRPVSINEVMASNETTMEDEAGEYDDWIELFNLTDIPVNLSGYSLSDNPSNIRKWVFPDGVVIPENGYLIVWADEDGSQGPVHANFKLSASGESLLLANALGQLVDTVNFRELPTDKGYARAPNGTGPFVIQAPTFHANNATVAVHNPQVAVTWAVLPTITRDRVRVVCDPNLTGFVQLTDLNGRLIQRQELQPELAFSLAGQPDGLYFVRLEAQGRSPEVKKVVKLK
ncbi:MAG: lamin tail domain-containing protein, partial [Saprospiraceae bacterium]|nr:lamin tail domain-containing protein [Saprospiraceae bacterium]